MKAKIQKWGNSLAVRVPKNIAEQVGVESNDVLEMNVEGGKIVLLPHVAVEYSLDDLLNGIDGVVLADQVKSLDWKARDAKKKSEVSPRVINDVLAKSLTLLFPDRSI